jgi:hypothetical protein
VLLARLDGDGDKSPATDDDPTHQWRRRRSIDR